jgi:hypothetical protein
MSEESSAADSAVLEFATAAYETLARRVIFRLQRIEASSVYGNDYQHKTLWDEYCHEVQDGPYDPIFNSLIETISQPARNSEAARGGVFYEADHFASGLVVYCHVASGTSRIRAGRRERRL